MNNEIDRFLADIIRGDDFFAQRGRCDFYSPEAWKSIIAEIPDSQLPIFELESIRQSWLDFIAQASYEMPLIQLLEVCVRLGYAFRVHAESMHSDK